MCVQANFVLDTFGKMWKYDDYTFTLGVYTATAGLYNFRSTVISNGWMGLIEDSQQEAFIVF